MKLIKNSLFVAWRYLLFHKLRTIVLVAALSIIIFVPAFLDVVVRKSQERINSRADNTPLILGQKGSALDLVVNSLYFISKRPKDITMQDVLDIDDTHLAYGIPLYTRFRAASHAIVGTSLDYFDLRGLSLKQGRNFAMLSEAVIGAKAAKTLNLNVGDTIISSPENVFDLAGQYPLQLKITGILNFSGTADDDVIFTDIRSTWVMAGLCHGHVDLTKTEDKSIILKKETGSVVANAKLKTYTVITQQNLKSFHFHGDKKTFPATSAIVVANDQKAKAILLGRYQKGDKGLILTQPKEVVKELISSILRIKHTLDTIVVVVSFSTLMTVFLVFLLSVRLREKEIRTIFPLGCSQMVIYQFIAAEILLICVASIFLAAAFFGVSLSYMDIFIKHLVV